MLRDASKKRPEAAASYVRAHAAELPALTFREATRQLPATARAELEALRLGQPRSRPRSGARR